MRSGCTRAKRPSASRSAAAENAASTVSRLAWIVASRAGSTLVTRARNASGEASVSFIGRVAQGQGVSRRGRSLGRFGKPPQVLTER